MLGFFGRQPNANKIRKKFDALWQDLKKIEKKIDAIKNKHDKVVLHQEGKEEEKDMTHSVSKHSHPANGSGIDTEARYEREANEAEQQEKKDKEWRENLKEAKQ